MRPFAEANAEKHIILMLDNFKPHTLAPCISKCEAIGVELLYLPAHTTSFMQPMDVSVNSPVKKRLCSAWSDWVYSKFEGRDVDSVFVLPKPGRAQAVSWVYEAWNNIDSRIVQNGFAAVGYPLLDLFPQQVVGVQMLEEYPDDATDDEADDI
jgi:hypothetical protein